MAPKGKKRNEKERRTKKLPWGIRMRRWRHEYPEHVISAAYYCYYLTTRTTRTTKKKKKKKETHKKRENVLRNKSDFCLIESRRFILISPVISRAPASKMRYS